MKTVGVLFTLLLIIVASDADPYGRILAKIDALTQKVEALTQKQDGKDPWIKLNTDAVCFGAKDSQFGSFKASTGGKLMKIKLVHLYGYVSCLAGASYDYYWSHWGCGYYNVYGGILDYTDVSLTTAANTILFPPSEIGRSDKWTLIPGYSSRSPELVMSIYNIPVEVTADQELRLWYTQDLRNGPESDNGGRVCADVYGYFM